MPDPGYADGDSPGFWGCLIAAVVLFGLLLLLRGCLM